MIAALSAIAGQTARLSLRGGGAFVGLVFFFAVVVVVPFAVGPDMPLLRRVGPAVLWIGALLASLLNLDRLFREDHEDGALDLLMMSGIPLSLVILAKCAGAWLATGLPLVIATPLFGLLLGVEPPALLATAASLLIGTPALVLTGALGAALVAGLGRGGPLVAILVLPFTIPVVIFGVSAAVTLSAAAFALLAAIALVAVVVVPVAGAAALRLSAE